MAFISRLRRPPARGSAGSAVTSTSCSTSPPSRTPRARATESAPASASLTRSPSATGCGLSAQHAGVDPGELEEVVDHPHHPVDLGAHLRVVTAGVVGEAVLQRLGHRPQAGQRRAQVVGDPRDELAPRLLQAPVRGRGTRRASRWSAGARPRARRTPPDRRAIGDVLTRSRRTRRAPSRIARDQRASADPTRKGEQQGHEAGDGGDRDRSHRGRARRGTWRARWPAMPATTESTATTRDPDRSATAPRHGGRSQTTTPPIRPTPPDHAAVVRTMTTWSCVMTRAPSGTRRPTPSPGGRDGSGRPRSSRAAGGRGRSPSTGRRRTSPRPRCSSSSRENA